MKELWPGWETVEAIGSGGFAQVYKIRKKDTGDGRDYYSALKIISIPQSPSEYAAYLGEGYDDATITAIFTNQVKRIEDEFHLMSQFKGNSNVVSYEDHMIVPHEDGRGWDILIRMELLTSLTAYCGSHAMTEEDTVNLGIGICHALELCEKKNIIHRDIKPQNIFVNEFGDYKLGDFGIAKSMDHTTQATKTGTYTYMAPEVYRGESYGATVDIYSLGLVLYWLLNERRMPFLPLPPTAPTATQIEESRSKRLAGAALPPPKNGSDALKSIVLKACAFCSADRYADPTAMRRDLERAKAMLVGGVLFGATETTVGIYADRTVSIAGAAGADRTVGIFGDGTAPTRREETDPGVPVAAASDGSGEGTVYITPPPATEDGGSGKGKLYAIIAAIAVIVIVVIILLLRGCGGEGDGVSTTTTWGGDDEPVITTDDEAPITTAPITTAPVTDAPEPSTHEHVLPSEGWQTDGASHWYVCACGEIAEKADHAYGEWEVTKEATESANGEKTRTCSVCSFAETDTIPMKAHEHSYATEWSDNETSHWHACACGEKEDLAAHSFGEWKITKAATETTTGTRERRCVVCDHLEKGTVPVLSHVHSFTGSFVKNETSHWHECACGEKADVSAHTFGSWTVTTPATCTTAGSQTHACVVCGYTENQTVRPLGHTEAVDAAVDPTCIKSGLTAGKHCSVCDTVLVKQNSIAATGIHTYENGLCTGCNKGEASTVTAGDQTFTVIYGQTYGALPEPTKTGYTFNGWYLNGVQIVAGTTVTTVGGHTLTPKWTANTYDIIYNINAPSIVSTLSYTGKSSGSMSASKGCVYDKDVSLTPNQFTIQGWKFKGWATAANGTVVYADGTTHKNLGGRNYNGEKINLYAVWEVDPYAVGKYVKTGVMVADTWESGTAYAVYNTVDSTPRNNIQSPNVIIDWSQASNMDIASYGVTDHADRKDHIDITPAVDNLYFVGDVDKEFVGLGIALCNFGDADTLAMHFYNFKFVSNYQTAIDLYQDQGANVVLDVTGECAIRTNITSGSIINGVQDLTFTGSGSLSLTAGDGADAVKEGTAYDGTAGQDGGIAVIATKVTIDTTGTVIITGGSGGNGEQGAQGEKGDDGGRRDIIGGKAGNGSKGQTGLVGGNGGAGGVAIKADSLVIKNGIITLTGGDGGDGGKGGKGGTGGNGGCSNSWGTYGGDAGDGGTGGTGGNGRKGAYGIECASIVSAESAVVSYEYGEDGKAGVGGDGGDPGSPGYYDGAGWDSGTARKGETGDPGLTGSPGSVV